MRRQGGADMARFGRRGRGGRHRCRLRGRRHRGRVTEGIEATGIVPGAGRACRSQAESATRGRAAGLGRDRSARLIGRGEGDGDAGRFRAAADSRQTADLEGAGDAVGRCGVGAVDGLVMIVEQPCGWAHHFRIIVPLGQLVVHEASCE